MITNELSDNPSRSFRADLKNDQPKKPNEVPSPDTDPKTVPGEEPAPDVWPHKDPEIYPGEEPLTAPPDAPPEIPEPPEY